MTSLLLAICCAGTDVHTDSSGGDTDGDGDGDADTAADTDTDTDTDVQTAELSGIISGPDGAALEARLQLCATSCRTGNTENNGSYAFAQAEVAPVVHSFDVFPTDDDYATVLFPISFAADAELDVSVPDNKVWADIGATTAEVALGGGMHVSLGTDDMKPPFGIDASPARATFVDEALWPPIDTLDGDLAALWYLDPYDTFPVESEGFAFRIEADSLPGEGPYQVWVMHYDVEEYTSRWEPAGTLTVADGWGTSDELLPLLNTIAITE